MPAPASEAAEHSSFIETPKQFIVVVLLAFLVPIFGIVLILQIIMGGTSADPASLSPAAVNARIQPVGRVEVTEAAPATASAAGVVDGKKVYDAACAACHASGVAGAPKLGDKAAWTTRVKSGMAAMLKSALGGKGAMPPRGGNGALSDVEVKASIEFMVGQSK
ncbi:MAG: cytochrome c5 family protein [Betaproteobacteria bacterium]|nr:cytochrome c5 family protein [Betaproteobacteria bacterium]